MASPSLPQNGGSRLYGGLHRLLQALAFVWMASVLISCQYLPSVFKRQAPVYEQPAPVWQPTPPGGPSQPAPGAQPHQHQPAAAASRGTRWNSGNSWASRFQGAPVNARGSGNAWQRGSRQVPGQYSVNKKTAPSRPASSWQNAPYYTQQQPAQAPAAPSYGYAAGGAAGFQGYDVSNTPNYSAAAARNYTIRSGDTLSGIARSYNVTVDALRRANNLTGDQIFRGATLIIPGR